MKRPLIRLPAGPRRAALRWGAPPVLVALFVCVLLRVLPAAAPEVYLEWGPTVDAQTRMALERRHHLIDPIHLGGTAWGYTIADTSNANVSSLLTLTEVVWRQGIEGNPPQVSGNEVIRLAGPFAVQSLIGLLVGGLLIAAGGAPTARIRQVYFLVAAALLIASCLTAELPSRASHRVGHWMGDSDTYSEDRGHFEAYSGYENVRFHFHLAGFVLNLIDRALGATDTSPGVAFQVLSGLMGGIALLEAAVVAMLAGWSAQSMRYAGLCVAAPFALMFFGYREVGYLSLSVAAFPLYLMTLDRPDDSRNMPLIRGAAGLQGLHASLHGLGLSAVTSLVMIALASANSLRQAMSRATTVFGWAFTAYAIWLPIYLMLLGLPIFPGHATGIPFRRLFESYVAEHRIVEPLLSLKGVRDIGAEALVVGVPVVLIGLMAARGESRRALLAGAAVSGAVLLLIWPAQGIGQDIDTVLATFPAFFAGAWICAARPRTALAALSMLAIGHALFWLVIRSEAFTNPRI